jgi:mercuric ion transport protein
MHIAPSIGEFTMRELIHFEARASDDAAIATDEARSVAPGLLAIGGVLAALGASSCCVLPFLFFTIGISGAWIGNLTALAAYQPLFISAAVGFLGLGFWRAYLHPKETCADRGYCARPRANRLTKVGLIFATVLIIAAASFNSLAPLFLS